MRPGLLGHTDVVGERSQHGGVMGILPSVREGAERVAIPEEVYEMGLDRFSDDHLDVGRTPLSIADERVQDFETAFDCVDESLEILANFLDSEYFEVVKVRNKPTGSRNDSAWITKPHRARPAPLPTSPRHKESRRQVQSPAGGGSDPPTLLSQHPRQREVVVRRDFRIRR